MKIFYDGFIWSVQKTGGINRYFANLISHLPSEFHPVVATDEKRVLHWPTHPQLKTHIGPSFSPRRVSRRLTRHFVQAVARLERPDIAHPTYYRSLSLRPPNALRCPCVVTIYDFIHRLFPEELDPHGEHQGVQSRAILAADAILCISQHTRSDLLRYFPGVESKITVTPLASEIDVSMAQGPQPVPEQPFFLYVGSRTRYKNFDGLLRAFSLFAATQPDVVLAVVGTSFDTDEQCLLTELNITSRVLHLGHVDDSHLAKLLNRSLALVYPSHYEGFGIPLLEAMKCETVVIAADNSSIPEVVGDAALLFASTDIDSLSQLLEATARGRIERAALIERGKRQAAQFSWERTAALTVRTYRRLV